MVQNAGPATTRGASVLVGRELEREQVRAALLRARAGALQALVIEGEAGIGKTRLTADAIAQAEELGFGVLHGTADELERYRPFSPIAEAVCLGGVGADRRSQLLHLLRDSASSDDAIAGQFRVVEAIVGTLEELSTVQPLLLVLEDLQWATESNFVALSSITRWLARAPLVILVNFRPVPRPPELDALVRAWEDLAVHLRLGPLRNDQVNDLVARLLAARPGAALSRKVAGASGNPLFVSELVETLRQEGAIVEDDGVADIVDAELPPSLRVTILRRMSFLPAPALAALQRAAVLGTSFSLADLSLVAGDTVSDLLIALHPALRAGVLVEAGDRVAFRHELFRNALYEDIPYSGRTALHAEVGRALADAGAPALQVAEHLALGARVGDAHAVTWLLHAARDARGWAAGTAVALYERALGLIDARDPAWDRAAAELVQPLLWVGRIEEAEKRALEALARPQPPAVEAELRAGLAEIFDVQGKKTQAREQRLRRAHIGGLGEHEELSNRAEALSPSSKEDEIDEIEAAARTKKNFHALVLALVARYHLECTRPTAFDRLPQILDEMMRAASAQRSSRTEDAERDMVRALAFRAEFHAASDRWEESLADHEAAIALAETVGAVAYLSTLHGVLAKHMATYGEWDDAVQQAERALDLAKGLRARGQQIAPRGLLAFLALHRGDTTAAEQHAQAIPEGPASLVAGEPVWPGWARALLAEMRGDLVQALGFLPSGTATAPDFIRIALAAGDVAAARQRLASVAEVAQAYDRPLYRSRLLRCQALVDRDAGAMLEAIESCPRSWSFTQAFTQEEAAALLLESGRQAEAVEQLNQAAASYERLGAKPYVARVRRSLRDLGVRAGARGARRRAQTGWESLTRKEREIAELAGGEGLSRPQIAKRLFVSVSTVRTHLDHVFQKLGVNSQRELMLIVARPQDRRD